MDLDFESKIIKSCYISLCMSLHMYNVVLYNQGSKYIHTSHVQGQKKTFMSSSIKIYKGIFRLMSSVCVVYTAPNMHLGTFYLPEENGNSCFRIG